MKNNDSSDLLHSIGLIIVLFGAIGSIYMMFNVGRNNSSLLLMTLFFAWDISPFIALLLIDKYSGRWTLFTRKTIYYLMILIPLFSVFFYSGIWNPPGTKPAFVFLVVPLISWILIGLVIPIANSMSQNEDSFKNY